MRPASLEDLEAAYCTPGEAATVKVARRITPLYREWIEASRFCVLTTVGPEGTDGSPRGDEGPVVQIWDEGTLAMPDWRGNDRIDSLRNIARDGRVSLMFMVPGHPNVVRVNGRGCVTLDEEARGRFERDSRRPRSVVVVEIGEIYSQCARALIRSELWGDAPKPALPSVGDVLREMSEGRIDGAEYDREWPGRAAKSMW